MARTAARESERLEVLRTNAALRSCAAALRVRSDRARHDALDTRLRGQAARRRAAELSAAVADVSGPSIPEGEVQLDELVEILTRHHRMAVHDAIIGVAVEMERAGYPPRVDWLRGGQALDLVRRVLDDSPRRGG